MINFYGLIIQDLMNPISYHFNNEIIINKSVQIMNKICYVLSLAEDYETQYLWVKYIHIRYENVSELQPMNYRERYEMLALSNQMHTSMSFQNILQSVFLINNAK